MEYKELIDAFAAKCGLEQPDAKDGVVAFEIDADGTVSSGCPHQRLLHERMQRRDPGGPARFEGKLRHPHRRKDGRRDHQAHPLREQPKRDFDTLAGRIETVSSFLKEDARSVINRSVTARAWLTGYYIVEYEQHGQDRAKYGEGLLKALSKRLGKADCSVPSLKKFRQFYQSYPELKLPVADYLSKRVGKGYSPIIQLPMTAGRIGESPIIQSHVDSSLFLSKYEVELPPKERIEAFLKSENGTGAQRQETQR